MTTPVRETTAEATYRWTRDAYERAVEAGVFGPDDRLTATGYRTLLSRRAGETIAPLARPLATIPVSDLLP